jgi:hypothetical protein
MMKASGSKPHVTNLLVAVSACGWKGLVGEESYVGHEERKIWWRRERMRK